MRAAYLLLAVLAAAGTARAQEYLNCGFAPGWKQTGAKRQYTPDTLFDYKDGAAEGYLGYGFVRMVGIDCKSGANTMAIDVSQMTDPDAAYGMLTANRDTSKPLEKIGMGAQVLTQSALLVKGVYYVEITQVMTNPSADDSAVLQSMVTRIAGLLQGRTTTPETLSWFPQENLTSAGLIPESVLGMRLLKRGYVARYKQGQAFIVKEPSPQAAAAILKQLRAKFAGATDAHAAEEAFQVNDKYLHGVCMFRKGTYLGGYADMPDAGQAVAEAAALAARMP